MHSCQSNPFKGLAPNKGFLYKSPKFALFLSLTHFFLRDSRTGGFRGPAWILSMLECSFGIFYTTRKMAHGSHDQIKKKIQVSRFFFSYWVWLPNVPRSQLGRKLQQCALFQRLLRRPGVWYGIPCGKEGTYHFLSCLFEDFALFQSDSNRPRNPLVRQSLMRYFSELATSGFPVSQDGIIS